MKSVSSSSSKDLSHKVKDFKIVLEDLRGRGLVLEDSNTVHKFTWQWVGLGWVDENRPTDNSATEYVIAMLFRAINRDC